jgi:hypothetical protein
VGALPKLDKRYLACQEMMGEIRSKGPMGLVQAIIDEYGDGWVGLGLKF